MASGFRQIGAVLGIAGLVALLGSGAAENLNAFHRAYQMVAAAGALSAITGLALGRIRAVDVERVADTGSAVADPVT